MTALLADTHTLLWWRASKASLSVPAREAMEDGSRVLFFSAASAWEIAIKRARGKLDVPDLLLETMQQRGFAELRVNADHALRAGSLPPHHGDPFDRMLVAQAQCEGLTLVTCDPDIAAYDVPVLW